MKKNLVLKRNVITIVLIERNPVQCLKIQDSSDQILQKNIAENRQRTNNNLVIALVKNLVLQRNQAIIIALIMTNVTIIALIKRNLVLERNQMIIIVLIALINRNVIVIALIRIIVILKKIVEQKDIEKNIVKNSSQHVQYTIFRDLDHSEKISFPQVHSEEIPFSQVHSEKIPFQHVQDTTTIHDTVFDFSISARTISVRTITICPESDPRNISNF
jgi:hypothetical protein